MSSILDRTGSHLWAMSQSHRITQEFISHRWREYPSVAELIDYHLFRFTVPFSMFKKLNDEVIIIKRAEKD